MGLDYLRSNTGKACQKRWNGSLNKMKTPTLLDLVIKEKERVVTASVCSGVEVKLGNSYVVHAVENALVVYENYKLIGQVENPSLSVMEAISVRCGIAEGVVERVGMFGTNMELSLR